MPTLYHFQSVLCRTHSDLGTAAALYVRIPGKATKLALLWALSENPEAPVITLDAIEWGAKVVTHLTKRMLFMAQFYVAEGKARPPQETRARAPGEARRED